MTTFWKRIDKLERRFAVTLILFSLILVITLLLYLFGYEVVRPASPDTVQVALSDKPTTDPHQRYNPSFPGHGRRHNSIFNKIDNGDTNVHKPKLPSIVYKKQPSVGINKQQGLRTTEPVIVINKHFYVLDQQPETTTSPSRSAKWDSWDLYWDSPDWVQIDNHRSNNLKKDVSTISGSKSEIRGQKDPKEVNWHDAHDSSRSDNFRYLSGRQLDSEYVVLPQQATATSLPGVTASREFEIEFDLISGGTTGGYIPTRSIPIDCDNVKCPEPISDCPRDSYRPSGEVPEGECCPFEEKCRCQPDICSPIDCGEGFTPKIIEKGSGLPGHCCDTFQCTPAVQSLPFKSHDAFCEDEGKRYAVNERWHQGACTECLCIDGGLKFCRKIVCPPSNVGCSRVEVPKGECCPVCAGCVSESGAIYNHSDEWHPDDCRLCHCDSGNVKCQMPMCSVDCDNPRKVAGRCCPVCDAPSIVTIPPLCPSIEFCHLRCTYGLTRDHNGCFICECQEYGSDFNELAPPKKLCPSIDLCNKRCAHGFVLDEHGCPKCACQKCSPLHTCYKHCLYGFQRNHYSCPICKCKTKPDTVVVQPSTPPHDQSICQELSYKSDGGMGSMSSSRDDGEWWFDGCRHCFCERGRQYCSLLTCPPAQCSNPITEEGDCCPKCPDSLLSYSSARVHSVCYAPSTGAVYVEGETWQLSACIRCTCHVGHVLCEVKNCPAAACSYPSKRPGRCCSTCSLHGKNLLEIGRSSVPCVDQTTGIAHEYGATWRIDVCRSCRCDKDGVALCFTEKCSDTACERPLHIKGQCCPICMNVQSEPLCHFLGVAYTNGETWQADVCTNCTCTQQGETLCTRMQCPRCIGTKQEVAGRCCPICISDAAERYLQSQKPGHEISTEEERHKYVGTTEEERMSHHHHLPVYMTVFILIVIVLVIAFALALCFFYRRSLKHCSCSRSSSTPPLIISEPQTPNNVHVMTANDKSDQWETNKCILERELRAEQHKGLLNGIVKNNSLRDPNYSPHSAIQLKRLSSPELIANGKL